MAEQAPPLAERFARFVHKPIDPSACCSGRIDPPVAGMVIGKGGKFGGMLLAHRVAWELAYGPIPSGLFVCHHCDHGLCVRPDHLFLGTSRQNVRDMMAKGRDQFTGERQHQAKLTEELVREIRQSPETGRALAKRFGVTFQTVSDVRRWKHWKHVSGPVILHKHRHAFGEDHGRARLTADQVREIRQSSERTAILAKHFGVARSTVHDVRSRKNWTHLP